MRLFLYVKYFFYIAINWNIIIAIYIIIQEIKGEKLYGIDTSGIDKLDIDNLANGKHATLYMPAIYSVLDVVFKEIKTFQIKHLLDIGSGKGRVLCVAAAKGCKKVSGIDFSKDLCISALNNLSIIQKSYPTLEAKIVCSDAFTYFIPDDVDCIFFFNPFDEYLMKGVLNKIQYSLINHPRKLKIIYANPIYKSLFIDNEFIETFHFRRLKYVEVSILEN